MSKHGRLWQYNGILFRLPRWTWTHTLCVRVLMLLGWHPQRAYPKAKKWFG